MNYTAVLLEAQASLLLLQARSLTWNEALHPRGKDGRFGDKDDSISTKTAVTSLIQDQPKAVQQEAADFHNLIKEEAQPLVTAQAVLAKARTHPELVSLGLLFGAAAVLGLKPKLAQAIATKIAEVQKTKAAQRAERRLAKKERDTQEIAEAGRRALAKHRATGTVGPEEGGEIEKALADAKAEEKIITRPEAALEIERIPTEKATTVELNPVRRPKSAVEKAEEEAADAAAASAGSPKKKKRKLPEWALGYGDAPVDAWAVADLD